jgi:hypothetical protein
LDQGIDCHNPGLSHGDILFDRTGTGSDRTYHDALPANRKSAPKYDHLTVIAGVDAVQRLSGLGQLCQISRRNIARASGECFVDGEINTADQGAVLTGERHQVPACINNRYVVGDADLFGFGLTCSQHTLRVWQRQGFKRLWHSVLPLLSLARSWLRAGKSFEGIGVFLDTSDAENDVKFDEFAEEGNRLTNE